MKEPEDVARKKFSFSDPHEDLELLEVLGSGAFGCVRKARRLRDGAVVAVKIVGVESDNKLTQDISREIETLVKVESPYTINVYQSYIFKGEAWILTEYCSGGSVADIVNATDGKCRFTENEIRTCLAWVLLGLDVLHSKGLMHRDIKASNLLISSEGKCKIADFGISAVISEGAKRHTVIGTPYYLAPEVIVAESYDLKADCWALGITALELANGFPPHFKLHPMRALLTIPKKPAPTLKGDAWSQPFKDFVAACCTKDPSTRSSVKDLLAHKWLAEIASEIKQQSGSRGSKELRQLVVRNMAALRRYRTMQADKFENSLLGLRHGLEHSRFQKDVTRSAAPSRGGQANESEGTAEVTQASSITSEDTPPTTPIRRGSSQRSLRIPLPRSATPVPGTTSPAPKSPVTKVLAPDEETPPTTPVRAQSRQNLAEKKASTSQQSGAAGSGKDFQRVALDFASTATRETDLATLNIEYQKARQELERIYLERCQALGSL